jgi:hypothetical protein
VSNSCLDSRSALPGGRRRLIRQTKCGSAFIRPSSEGKYLFDNKAYKWRFPGWEELNAQIIADFLNCLWKKRNLGTSGGSKHENCRNAVEFDYAGMIRSAQHLVDFFS